jgi:hypothetical protein
VVPVVKEKCFYFSSFQIAGKGSHFTQVVQSKVLQEAANSGENLTFDPLSIPPHQGELIFVGRDIL